jgi:glycosyltransferase involved in cell wall biosynthesis
MRICMVSYDMQDFGGLEEYAVNLAIGLRQQGQDVSYLSMAWVPRENQYYCRLKASNIPLVQPPAWISKAVSDWPTKEKILRAVMWFFHPLTLLLGLGLSIFKRRTIRQAWHSAYNWLKGQLMDRFIGPDYRKIIGRMLLSWWNLRWHPEILHIHGYTTTLLFVIDWADAKGIPVAYEEHQTPDPQFNWWKGFEKTINKADRVIAVSETSAQGLREVCGVTRPIFVRGPLLPDPFAAGWSRDYSFQSSGTLTITTVARLYVTKGLTYLLEAAAIVKNTNPRVEFKVYGDGELRSELLEKAAALGLDGKNIFMGAFTTREELDHILTHTDIFLLSSILEGQPLVIVEAMAYGCPIVSTNVGGIPELITDGVNGLLCPPEKPQCLAEKIKWLIGDPAQRERLGRAARSYYENSPFGAKAGADFFISVYSEVLEGRQRFEGTNQKEFRKRKRRFLIP